MFCILLTIVIKHISFLMGVWVLEFSSLFSFSSFMVQIFWLVAMSHTNDKVWRHLILTFAVFTRWSINICVLLVHQESLQMLICLVFTPHIIESSYRLNWDNIRRVPLTWKKLLRSLHRRRFCPLKHYMPHESKNLKLHRK